MEADRLGVFHGAVHISGFKLQVAPNYPAYFALNGVVKPSVVRSKLPTGPSANELFTATFSPIFSRLKYLAGSPEHATSTARII